MEIVINGQPRQVPEGQTVLDLLASLELDPARLALELDGRILQSSYWGKRSYTPGPAWKSSILWAAAKKTLPRALTRLSSAVQS